MVFAITVKTQSKLRLGPHKKIRRVPPFGRCLSQEKISVGTLPKSVTSRNALVSTPLLKKTTLARSPKSTSLVYLCQFNQVSLALFPLDYSISMNAL